MDNNIRFKTIGRIEEFPKSVVKELNALKTLSANNDGMEMCLALNYGGRLELVDACRKLATEVAAGNLRPEEISETLLQENLYDSRMPDVDLLIRTAGELRVSNFLLWQISYGEIYVTDSLWPDFSIEDLSKALLSYSCRKRKFGGLARPVDA